MKAVVNKEPASQKTAGFTRALSKGVIPIALPGVGKSVFAAGAELKNTFCFTKGNQAFVSQSIGNLNDFKVYQYYQQAIRRLKKTLKIEPEVIAYDMHPDYLSTRYAMSLDSSLPRIAIQHHQAHIASCMAEHQLQKEVIGVAFDGTGYGLDGNIWGAEVFAGSYREFKRVYHLRYIPLPGGDQAAKQPWRMAVSYIYQSFGEGALKFISRWKDSSLILSMIRKGINSPLASSMGRLFDAVSSIIGLCDVNSYEGEAPIKLESRCGGRKKAQAYPYHIKGGVIDVSAMIGEIVLNRESPAEVAVRFHYTIADIVLKAALQIRAEYGIDKAVLSGGVFQNKVLTELSLELLKKNGFSAFTHSMVPPNDGGISLGQAAIAQELTRCA